MSSKTVIKALNVLEEFTAETPKWGLRELGRKLEISHTIVHRILSTFEERGYVFHNPETNKYELGIRFLELSNVVEENLSISELIQPIMKKIAMETGESVVLTLLDNNEGLFVKIVESEKHVRFAQSVGKRAPLYVGASHKTMLAYLPANQQALIIEEGLANKAKQIHSKAELLQSIASIREKGWAFSREETMSDVSAVSIPLFDSQQQILGSLSVAGPIFRLTSEEAENFIVPVLQRERKEMDYILKKVCFPTRRNYLVDNIN